MIVSKGRKLKSSGSSMILFVYKSSTCTLDHAENPLKPVSVHRGHLWEVELRVETCKKHFTSNTMLFYVIK